MAMTLTQDDIDAIAAAILVTPGQPIATDASGRVDLVDAPNATAVAAIATKTLTTLIIPNLVSGSLAEYVYDTKIASGYGHIINNAIGAWTGSGVNTVLGAFKALLSKTASTPSDIGGTFDPATDSVEALRDRGDAAWATADVSGLATAAALATVDGIVDDILVDTGTTIPGLLAAELSSSSDSTTSGAITRTRGNTWTINATIGAITGYTSLWFTVKHSQDDADSDAILQIKLNSTGSDDDLLYVNGATASDSTLGAITVIDASTGAIIIAVDETVTDDMPAGAFYYDVQVLNSGAVTTPDSGKFTITADVTRSVT